MHDYGRALLAPNKNSNQAGLYRPSRNRLVCYQK